MRMSRKLRRARQRRLAAEKKARNIVTKSVQLATAAMLMWHGMTLPAYAMPEGGQVTAGSAVIGQAGSAMTIQQQTRLAAINWQSFGIAAGEAVRFFQPDAGSAVLNRVIGNNPSAIFGQLSANGRVLLVNQNGVYFAPGAQVSVGGLVATSLSITDADFMAGRYAFAKQGKAGSVINQGSIIAENQGLVALLAPEVKNGGIIVAKKGSVVLAAGNQATLDFNGDGKVQLALGEGALKAAADNKGLIEADGGLVLMTAKAGQDLTSAVVNQSGIIRARSLDGQSGGITLHAVDGTVQNAGTLDASATAGQGGRVDVFGKDITLAAGAQIDVSGSAGGGKARVGGDWQGSGDAPHAQTVTIAQGAAINADAVNTGKGGAVAVWSDGTTRFNGSISAKGGAQGGDGGSVETSGHTLQVDSGSVNASAAKGKSGEWLLDPYDVTIIDTGDDMSGGGAYVPTHDSSTVRAGTIKAALNNGSSVTIKTGNIPGVGSNGTQAGTITVAADIAKTTGSDATLALEAHKDIIINKNVTNTSSAGKLNVDLHADTDNTGGGRIVVNSGAAISTNGGWAALHGGDAVTAADGSVSGGSSSYAKNIVNNADPGVEINGTINTSDTSGGTGGNITIYGETTSIADGAAGVKLSDGGQLTSGGGSVTVNGLLSGVAASIKNTDAAVTLAGAINAGAGNVTLSGDRGGVGSNGTGINFAAGTGQGITSAKDVTLIADTMAFPGAGAISGAGTVSLKPLTANRAINVGTGAGSGGLDLTKAGLFTTTFQNFAQTVIGADAGTGTITVNNASFNNDVTLQAPTGAGNIQITGGLTAPDKTVTLKAGHDATEQVGGVIDANGLSLQGSGAAFTLNGANNISVLSGTTKNFAFTDTDGFLVGGTGLTFTGTSSLTATKGNVTIGQTISKAGTADADLTVTATGMGGAITVNNSAAVQLGAGATGKLNVNFNAGTLALADNTSKINANGGNITLKADVMTLPAGAAGGLVASNGGVLNIDRLTAGTIDIGGSTGGALQISETAFGNAAPVFGNGFSQVNIGHTTNTAGGASTAGNATAVNIADGKTLTVTDPLYIKANGPTGSISLGANSGIDSAGDGGNALTLEAPIINFPGSGTGTLYVGQTATTAAATPKSVLTLRANTINNWAQAQFGNHGGNGMLFIQRQDNNGFTVGGSDENSTLVTDTGFSQIAGGNFNNVTVGTTSSGDVTVNAITSLPTYTSLLSGGAVNIAEAVSAPAGALTFKAGSLTQSAGLTVDKLLLLDSGNGTGSFDLSTSTNNINTVAANVGGNLALATANDLTVGSVQDRTVIPAAMVDGITAKTGSIKLAVAKPDGKLTLNQKVYSGASGTGNGAITLVADEMGFDGSGNGKVRTASELQIYPYTPNNPINVGSGLTAGLDIAADRFGSGNELGGNYSKIILGRLLSKADDANQRGDINIGSAAQTTTFTSNLELRTLGNVRLDGRVNVGTADPWKDLTITANKLTMPSGSDLYVHDLNLNLDSGLDLSDTNVHDVGQIDGAGNLNIAVPAGKDIYISDTYDPNDNSQRRGGGYKIPYVTINDVFKGFPAFGVTGDKNVYFQQGAINKSVTVVAGQDSSHGVTVEENVRISGSGTKVDITGGNFTMNSGTNLDVAGNNAVINITAKDGDITLADAPDAAHATKLTVNGQNQANTGDNATINLTASGKVTLGKNAQTAINGAGANVTVTGNEFGVGSNALINLGNDTAGNFTLQADKLTATAADTDGIANITGKGTLMLMPRNTGTAMNVNSTGAGSGLVVTDAQLNGGLFGPDFKDLILGNPGGTGPVTINGVNLNNNVTIRNGPVGQINIGSDDLSVAANKKVTLQAGSLNNAGGTGSINVGAGGTVNLYTNDLTKLTDNGGAPTVTGTGALGIATYDGTTAILLGGDTSHGGLSLTNDKFSKVFGPDFSAYAIGNTAQQTIYVDNANLTKDTSLTADNIYFYPINPADTASTSISVGDKTLTINANNAKQAASQSGGVITAGSLALSGGNFDLQGSNAISKLTATADKVQVKSLSPLIIAGVDTTGGAAGNVTLTADAMTFTGAVKGNGELTVQQASNDRKLNLGANPDGSNALYLGSSLFDGQVFKDGFRHVYLGNENSTAAVTIGGDLTFVDPTTIRSPAGDSITLAPDANITTKDDSGQHGSSLEFITTTLTTAKDTAAGKISTIKTDGDLKLTVDNMDLAGDNAAPPVSLVSPESSKLYIQTMSQDRNLGLDRFTNNVQSDKLALQSTYFDGLPNPNNPANQRVFADGYSQIVLGRADGTGTLTQVGTTGFSDSVLIVQAKNNAGGSVDVSGKINTGGNDFTVESKIVDIHNAQIDAGTGNVLLSADDLKIKDSTIDAHGELTIKTYDPNTKINLGDGTGDGLNLDSKWFSGTGTDRVFGDGFSKITIGSETGTGDITVKDDFAVNKDLAIKSGSGSVTVADGKTLDLNNNDLTITTNTGTVNIPGTVTEVKTLGITTGSSITLSNPGNTITTVGDVSAKDGINIQNKGDVTVGGTVTNTGAGKDVTIHTTGNITIGSGGSVNSKDEALLVAENGNFINNNNSGSAINADNRWVVYTDNPDGNQPGNLEKPGDFHRYGTDYGDTTSLIDNTPSGGTNYAGSGFAYKDRPQVVIYGEKVYGQDYANFFTGGKLKATANGVVIGGNAWEQTFLNYLLNGATFTNGKLLTASSNYSVGNGLNQTTNVNSPTSLYGSAYGDSGNQLGASYTGANPFNYDVKIQLRVTPKPVTVTANNDSKVYDGIVYNSYTAGKGVTYSGFIAQDVSGVPGYTDGAAITADKIKSGTLTKNDIVYGGDSQSAINVGSYNIGI